MTAQIEHANLTVKDADATAAWLCTLFDWQIRWAGPAINGGRSIHVGTRDRYLAVYSPATPAGKAPVSYDIVGGLNHIGIVVDDIKATEAKVVALGFLPEKHADYEPGQRFYFHDHDGIEFEVVQYD